MVLSFNYLHMDNLLSLNDARGRAGEVSLCVGQVGKELRSSVITILELFGDEVSGFWFGPEPSKTGFI